MWRHRRNFNGAEKMVILREHLIEKVPVSEVCEKHGVQPTLFYHWQKKLFEEGAVVFEQPRGKPIARLEANERIIPGTCADDAREAIAEQMRERQVMRQAARSSAKRTRTAVARINEHSRALRAELRKTGTCDAVDFQPNIVPVQTGFEEASKAVRSGFDAPLYRPPDPAEYEDLFLDPVTEPDPEEDEGMEALFIEDHPVTEDGGLEDLL